MRLFGYELRKKRSYTVGRNQNFTDEDREAAKEIRLLKQEAKKKDFEMKRLEQDYEITIKKQELREMKEHLFPRSEPQTGDTSEAEALFMTTFLPLITGNQTPAVGSSPTAQPTQTEITVTDDGKLQELLRGVPKKYLKIAKNMPDEFLHATLKKQTAYDDNTIKRTIEIYRSGNF